MCVHYILGIFHVTHFCVYYIIKQGHMRSNGLQAKGWEEGLTVAYEEKVTLEKGSLCHWVWKTSEGK